MFNPPTHRLRGLALRGVNPSKLGQEVASAVCTETAEGADATEQEDGMALTLRPLHSRTNKWLVRWRMVLFRLFAPLVEVLYEAPGFWKLLAWPSIQACSSFGVGSLTLGPAIATVFGDNAADMINLTCIGTPLVATIFSASLGRWSDRHDRRWSGMLLVLGSQGPLLAVVVFGATKLGVSSMLFLCVLAGPLRSQISGNPLQWALLADRLPPKFRSVGFQMFGWVPAIFSFVVAPGYKWLLHAFPDHAVLIFDVIFIVGNGLALLTIWSLGTKPLLQRDEEEGVGAGPAKASPVPAVQDSRKAGRDDRLSYLQTLRNAMELIRSDYELTVVTIALSLFTLPDLAATYPGSLIQMQIMGITGEGKSEQQQEFVYWQSVWPRVIGIFPNIAISFAVHYFGPTSTMAIWMPFTCVCFATPCVLLWWRGPAWYVLASVAIHLPITCFAPLQSLASLRVPREKVGAAMAAIDVFKDLMAFLAPIMMMVVMGAIKTHCHTEEALSRAYAWIFPGCAALMLAAWPPVLLIACRSRPSRDDLSAFDNAC